MRLEPADIVCTKSKGKLGKLIRFFTRHIGEPRTQVNHVGVITVGGISSNAVIVEALKHVRRCYLAEGYGGDDAPDIAVFRPKNLTEMERFLVASKAESQVGKNYGYLKLLTHFGDWGVTAAKSAITLGRCRGDVYFFRRLTKNGNYPICSWLVSHAYAFVGKDFGVDAGAASPDDIWDFCIENPDKYLMVMPLGNLDEFRRHA